MYKLDSRQPDTMLGYGNNTTIQAGAGGNDEYISRAQLRLISLILVIVLIPLFSVMGSVGNILSIVVLIHQRMRNQINCILAALCVSDTLFLCHSLIFFGINVYSKIDPVAGAAKRAEVYPIAGAYGSVVTARITSWLTVLLCVERFIAVYCPMKAKTICNVRHTCAAILAIWAITIAVFIPFTQKYEAKEIAIPPGNRTIFKLVKTKFYLDNHSFYNVYGTLLNVIFRFAPIGIVLVLNVAIIRTVHSAWKLRRRLSEPKIATTTSLPRFQSMVMDKRNSPPLRDTNGNGPCGFRSSRNKQPTKVGISDDSRITIMLLTVSFVFLVCILPGAINSIVTHVYPEYSRLGRHKNLYIVISSVTYLLETINSAVNFIIYMLLSRRFRLLYKHICCCKKDASYRTLMSISSVKEKFRWSKRSRLSTEPGYGRKAISDIGPVTNGNYRNSEDEMVVDLYDHGHTDIGVHHDKVEFYNSSSFESINLLEIKRVEC